MSEKRGNTGRDRPRKRFRSDGTPIWGQRSIDGPGIWATCVRGKEKQTVGELYDLFGSLAEELWPTGSSKASADDIDPQEGGDDSDDEDLEKQIAKEVNSLKRPRREQRFANCQTSTPCVVFISSKAPIDSVKLVTTHVENVIKTGVSKTRYTQRLTPVSGSCPTNLQEIKSLCERFLKPVIDEYGEKHFTYKIELRIRNHNTLPRLSIIQELAKCLPEQYKVNLETPEVFILVEIFKSVCGISVVKDYYQMQKFNVMEIVNTIHENETFQKGEGRVETKSTGNPPEK